jgi:hypothetical protein
VKGADDGPITADCDRLTELVHHIRIRSHALEAIYICLSFVNSDPPG